MTEESSSTSTTLLATRTETAFPILSRGVAVNAPLIGVSRDKWGNGRTVRAVEVEQNNGCREARHVTRACPSLPL